MKIYQKLEQILKFRIYSNAEIPEYLKKLSLIGKLDDVAKLALFNLILTKLGEIEDKEDTLVVTEGLITYGENKMYPFNSPTTTSDSTLNTTLKCPDCDFVAKSKLGLMSHSRHCKHKK
jgi:hypothetical protein